MLKVGTIKEIWRYPVKGMAGESVKRCGLGKTGLTGDRIWALRDTARQEIQSCKFRPELLLCSARCHSGDATGPGDQVDILFPDNTVLSSDNTEIHAKLSALTGHPSTLESLRPASDRDFYRRHKRDNHTWLEELKATFDREAGEPLPDLDHLPQSAVDFVSLLGTFFLVTPFHIVTTATLAHLKSLHPQSDWDRRRFRPNVVIETEPGAEGLLEQAWIGKRLTLGDARVDRTETAPRCGAVTRAQRDFATDKTILRTVVRDADQNVGIYGAVADGGVLRVGDVVYVN